MKKALILLSSILLLTSCLNNNQSTETPVNNTGSNTEATTTVNENGETKYIRYTLRDTDANGEIIETNTTEGANVLTVTIGTH